MKNSISSLFLSAATTALVAMTLVPGPARAADQAGVIEVKLATILPRGLSQDAVLKKLEQEWRKASSGKVELRRAAGGLKDGEATIVKKLNSGNYQAGLLSVTGLSEIEKDASVLQNMPLVFKSWDELDFVREKIRPELEAKILKKGFVVLFWADSGWVNFFSVKPAVTPAEFKPMRMFTWAAEESHLNLIKSLGYKPVPLETDGIHQAFATGMIQCAPIAPTFALGVQIPTVAPHVVDVNWAPIVGAAVIRRETWSRIPADLQPKLLALCDVAGKEIRAEGRKFHDEALKTLERGPRTAVHKPTAEQLTEWAALAREVEPKIRGAMVPAEIFDRVQKLLQEYRSAGSQPK